MAGLSAAFLLAVVAFSSIVVASEAEHDCAGQDCPICLEMQGCVANFQLLGSSHGGNAGTAMPVAIPAGTEKFVACAYRAPSQTLQTLDVRFDE